MENVTLVIMAAGIGSRFGKGIKQLESVGPNGEIIMDYSIKDAISAGFNKVVFVIRKDIENDFRKIIGDRIEQLVNVEYVYQETNSISQIYQDKFQNRKKPWGTGQAILCCKNIIHEPFLVINADDYYGKEAYKKAYEELTKEKNNEKLQVTMIGFILKNTLSKNGTVTRAICKTNKENILEEIIETKNIDKDMILEKNIDENTLVSMNMWGFRQNIFNVLEEYFDEFLNKIEKNDNSSEFLLPIFIEELLKKNKVNVNVLETNEQWFGMTYKEDIEEVKEKILEMCS